MVEVPAVGCPVDPEFDPLSPEYLADPVAVLRRIPPEHRPLFFAPKLGYYVVTDHADTDALEILPLDVSAGSVEVSAELDLAVSTNDGVIADPLEPRFLVPLIDLVCADVGARPRGGAVNDEVPGSVSHFYSFKDFKARSAASKSATALSRLS